MTSVLRLASLSYAIALVDASFLSFWPDRDADNWGPATQTAGLTEIDPVGWTPKPTAPPGAKPLNFDLRRRQQTTASSASTCGFPAENISAMEDTVMRYNGKVLRGVVVKQIPVIAEYQRLASNPRDRSPLSLMLGRLSGSEPTNAVTITVFPGTSSSTSTGPVATEPVNTVSGTSRTGAIVGGTVGGVAGLALIIAAIFFCMRYRRRRGGGAEEVEGSPPYPRRSYPAASVYPSGLPEPQYNSDFYGELPPQMAQSSTQHMTGYPPPTNYESNFEPNYEPNHEPVAVPREIHRPTRPSTFVPGSPKPNEDDIVSPITPGDQLNPADDPATYTWISNPTPPPQSEYSPYSPPPPPQFQSYRPYPGT
ncbi:hypothetical protein Hte_007108 [Hypoxylon texense]